MKVTHTRYLHSFCPSQFCSLSLPLFLSSISLYASRCLALKYPYNDLAECCCPPLLCKHTLSHIHTRLIVIRVLVYTYTCICVCVCVCHTRESLNRQHRLLLSNISCPHHQVSLYVLRSGRHSYKREHCALTWTCYLSALSKYSFLLCAYFVCCHAFSRSSKYNSASSTTSTVFVWIFGFRFQYSTG